MFDALDTPPIVAAIDPVPAVRSSQAIRMFPAGLASSPDREIVVLLPPATLFPDAAIVVVPSYILQMKFAAAGAVNVTVPLAFQVPVVPCATLGPSANAPLGVVTLEVSELVKAGISIAIVGLGVPVIAMPAPAVRSDARLTP